MKPKYLITAILLFASLIAVWHAPATAQLTGLQSAGMMAVLVFVSLACLATPGRGQLGAAPDTIDISSNLGLTRVLDSALEAFKRTILPLTMFATAFKDVVLSGSDTIDVPYYPLQGITSKDFSGTYDFATGAGAKLDVRRLTINKRKYQPIAATSAQLARMPALDLDKLGRMKAQKLAFDITQDILGLVTAANFGAAAFTGAASTFDSDDVVDLRAAANSNKTGPTSVTDGVTTNTSTTVTSATAQFTFSDIGSTISGTGIPASTTIAGVTSATTATLSAAATASGTGITFTLGRVVIPWPEESRGLLLNPDYDGALFKDDAVKDASAYGDPKVIQQGMLPRVLGFNYAQTAAIPGNSENLVGFIAHESAMIVGFSPVEPADGGRIVDYRVVTDPETGISLEYREWFSPDTDTLKRVIEANYGYAVGEARALKRLVSA